MIILRSLEALKTDLVEIKKFHNINCEITPTKDMIMLELELKFIPTKKVNFQINLIETWYESINITLPVCEMIDS